MKVLLACEESQTCTVEFRLVGHEAYSCDILPTSGCNPEWHMQCDALSIINNNWDMIIAFPPCTHLAGSGAKHFKEKIADGRQQQAIDFFMAIVNADCERIAIENSVGVMSTKYRKPDQIINPWQFGDEYSKRTCLWLKNLPKLTETNIVGKGKMQVLKSGKKIPEWYSNAKKEDRSKIRSKTSKGIAKAMASQWGNVKCI